jgi:hypothetical protein
MLHHVMHTDWCRSMQIKPHMRAVMHAGQQPQRFRLLTDSMAPPAYQALAATAVQAVHAVSVCPCRALTASILAAHAADPARRFSINRSSAHSRQTTSRAQHSGRSSRPLSSTLMEALRGTRPSSAAIAAHIEGFGDDFEEGCEEQLDVGSTVEEEVGACTLPGQPVRCTCAAAGCAAV